MYHTLIIVGNLGRDPETRTTPNGAQVTSFNVATNRTYTNSQGEKVKETCWFRISTWGKLAENCDKFIRKGSKVLVEGRLNPDPNTGGPKVWQGQNGPGASYEITAEKVRFLSSNGENGASQVEGEEPQEEEIPF